ncbi:mechanosensitive ion channel family protein [Dactylococcopsis salina]|uniref:Small-conductance mechanosensitive channel n=1 Tax=Dactylococcopsis salina (strain PCC 8305) TaxID=13035 RepID=K9YXP4_DACS8|nr:mechanosensitive ion channel domain-containing protein [Dactylococcopsis salina]AFZ50883.1 small-conductance mechanosensitive channel [Dactylococcopsis salina PCC 8305]
MTNNSHSFLLPSLFSEVDPSSLEDAESILNLVDQMDRLISEESISIDPLYLALGGLTILIITLIFVIPSLLRFLASRFLPLELREAYQQIFVPYQRWIILSIGFSVIDIILLLNPDKPTWLYISEFFLGGAIAINICLLAFTLFDQFFGGYLLDLALRSRNNVNSELLAFIKFVANALIILIVIFIFAESHRLSVTGLIASVGVGGLAIAFASQKVLEQVLWTILLYVDRPFVVDDYIHLQDGTFGRVEGIGWRSSKIRLSGKGTLVVIPNSMLTQMSVENLSGAQKIITLLNILFDRGIPEQEKALVRQIILDSTRDIYGIDHRLTEVKFEEVGNSSNGTSGKVKAQVTFFILGSGSLALEIRTQLLEAARRNISKRLKDYGIGFSIDEKPINIDSPMNI